MVEISLLEDVVLEEVIGAEDEEDLEAWLAGLVIEIRELNIDKVLEGFHIAICDQLGEGDMISECGEPEVRNTLRGGGDVFRQGGILFILFDGVLLATIELLPCGLSGSSDDRMSAIIQRFLEAKVLREGVGKRYGSNAIAAYFLLELETLALILVLQLVLLDLDTLEPLDVELYFDRETLDVPGTLANKFSEPSVDHAEHLVLHSAEINVCSIAIILLVIFSDVWDRWS